MTVPAPGRLSALVFDLDGTLIDSAPDIAAALNALLAELALPPLPVTDVKRMIGDGIAVLVERAVAANGSKVDFSEDLVGRFRGHYYARLTEETRPFPGVAETLERLQAAGWRMAVCTNKLAAPAQRILKALGLDGYFGALAGGDSYATKKPAAEPLLGVLESLGAARSEALMVGDSPADVKAARNAGLPVVAVSYGYRRVAADALGADILIDEFTALPDAIARLSGNHRRPRA